MHTRATML